MDVITRSFELLAEDRAACAAEHRDYEAKVVHIQPGLASARGSFSDSPALLAASYVIACEVLDRCRVGSSFTPGHYHASHPKNIR